MRLVAEPLWRGPTGCVAQSATSADDGSPVIQLINDRIFDRAEIRLAELGCA
jgi:hypothetical protein